MGHARIQKLNHLALVWGTGNRCRPLLNVIFRTFAGFRTGQGGRGRHTASAGPAIGKSELISTVPAIRTTENARAAGSTNWIGPVIELLPGYGNGDGLVDTTDVSGVVVR